MQCDVWTCRDDPALRLITILEAGIPFPLMGETWDFTGTLGVDQEIADEVAKAGFVTMRSTAPFTPGGIVGRQADRR